MRETWYVLEDGSVVDPAEVSPGQGESLVHRSGVRVARRGDVPSTRSIIPDEERAKYATREAVPEKPARGYKTRAMKAD